MTYKSIIECFNSTLTTNPNSIALQYNDISFTWFQLEEFSNVLANKFIEIGIRKNTHTGICCVNNPNWVCVFLALQKIGSITVLISHSCKFNELKTLIEIADIEYLCIEEQNEIYKTVSNHITTLSSFKKIINIQNATDIKSSSFNNLKHNILIENNIRQNNKNDVACILFTSGTTSTPKGVMLSNKNILNTAESICKNMHWNTNDIMCITVPFHHCFGLVGCLISAIFSGMKIVIPSNLLRVSKYIEKYKCTILNNVPSVFLSMINSKTYTKYDISTLNSGIIAGDYVSQNDYIRICKELDIPKLQMSYGLTEASPSVTFSNYNDTIEEKSDNVGTVINDIEVCILNSNEIKSNNLYETGEILVKGYNVMQGYYNYNKTINKVIDSKGWLHTGDIGYFDKNNLLHLIGRKKEIIKKYGENISPFEIEECILSYPNINQVKVLPSTLNKVFKDEIVACIIPNQSKKINIPSLRHCLSECLTDYKIPNYILIFSEFPLTCTGKIDIKKLRIEALNKIEFCNCTAEL